MTSIKLNTEIAASASIVYEALMDFPSYRGWNPMIVEISGTPTVGGKIEGVLKFETREPSAFKSTVLVNESNKEFRWAGSVWAAFIYRGEHYFLIEETQAGCVFTHDETWSGLFEPLITKMIGKENLEASFKSFNDALKQRAEGVTQAQN